MKTILFQGDSITDCGRSRDEGLIGIHSPYAYGTGYPYMAAARLSLDQPGKYVFEADLFYHIQAFLCLNQA